MRPLVSRTHALELLRAMVRITRFEEKCVELYSAAEIRGFMHLYIGEEAIAVGVMNALSPDDAVVATYREHGHAIARGIGMGPIMAEMLGRREGVSGGRGGSMHLFDAASRFYGGNAIVGGGLPLAVGLALADKMSKRNRVTCCIFGEGAVAEGEFHESLNLAALWKLPVLFVCENNLYAMGTAIERSESVTDIHQKAAAYGMTSEAIDGMDVIETEDAAKRAVEQIRGGAGPAFIEYRTYRFRAHSMFDAELYRDKAEVEQWKERGPVKTLVARLEAAGLGSHDDLTAIEAEADVEIEAAVAFARAGTLEPIDELSCFVYADDAQNAHIATIARCMDGE
jgi:pyruvate dehydrogenase E1 component alpha subunit